MPITINKSLLKRNQVFVVICLTFTMLILFHYLLNVYYASNNELVKANQNQEGFEKSLSVLDTEEFMADLKQKLLSEREDQIMEQLKQDLFKENAWRIVNEIKDDVKIKSKEFLSKKAEQNVEITKLFENYLNIESESQFTRHHTQIVDLIYNRFELSVDSIEENVTKIDRIPYFNISDVSNSYSLRNFYGLIDLNNETRSSLTENHRKFVKYVKEQNFNLSLYKGNGIVIVDQDLLTSLLLVKQIRETGSRLPIEVMVSKDELYDQTLCESVFPKFNSTCVKIMDVIPILSERRITHFEVLSLFVSTFENIILIKDTTIPIRNLDSLLESELFAKTSCILWPASYQRTTSPYYYEIAEISLGEPVRKDSIGYKKDWKSRRDTPIYDLSGALSTHTIDLNQLVISKKENYEAILLALYYELNQYIYQHLLQQESTNHDRDVLNSRESLIAALNYYHSPYYIVSHRTSLPQSNLNLSHTPHQLISKYDPIQDYIQKSQFENYMLLNKIDSRTNLYLDEPQTKELYQAIQNKLYDETLSPKLVPPSQFFVTVQNFAVSSFDPLDVFGKEDDIQFRRKYNTLALNDEIEMDLEMRVTAIAKWIACELKERVDDEVTSIWSRTGRDRNKACNYLKEMANYLAEVSDYPDSQDLTGLLSVSA